MPISSNEIITNLIAFYKKQGVDLSYILEDPIFEKLPLAEKIKIIKNHAGEIHAGTNPNWTPDERASVISGGIMGSMAGLGAGAAGALLGEKLLHTVSANSGIELASQMAKNKAYLATVAGGILVGAGLGVGVNWLKERNRVRARQALRDQLGAISKNPNLENTLGALSIKSTFERSHELDKQLSQAIAQKVMSDIGGDAHKTYASGMYPRWYEQFSGQNFPLD